MMFWIYLKEIKNTDQKSQVSDLFRVGNFAVGLYCSIGCNSIFNFGRYPEFA